MAKDQVVTNMPTMAQMKHIKRQSIYAHTRKESDTNACKFHHGIGLSSTNSL